MTRKQAPDVISYRTKFTSPFGIFNLVWEEASKRSVVTQIIIPSVNLPDSIKNSVPYLASDKVTTRVIPRLCKEIQAFLMGKDVTFDLSVIALDRCTEFQRRVLIAEYNIPRGKVSTYGRIAAHLGHPKAARAVGRALATHPFPIVIPCHRAVQSNGRLGGYQGGLKMKRKLLEMEGVRISANGAVETEAFHY
jgi:methylated-DNA-[protein]-cysteine S-methyltransferase